MEEKRIVLVVDDDEDLLFITKILLQESFIVVTATNGRQAIETFQKTSPDIVLMDIIMPEMDGIEATKKILQIKPSAMIIGLTAFAKTRGERMISAGAIKVITKPITKEKLNQVISSVLNFDFK